MPCSKHSWRINLWQSEIKEHKILLQSSNIKSTSHHPITICNLTRPLMVFQLCTCIYLVWVFNNVTISRFVKESLVDRPYVRNDWWLPSCWKLVQAATGTPGAVKTTGVLMYDNIMSLWMWTETHINKLHAEGEVLPSIRIKQQRTWREVDIIKYKSCRNVYKWY